MIERIVIEYGQLIINFLMSCGGGYANGISEFTEYAIFRCLGSGQYVLGFDKEGIRYFACYWKITPDDIDGIKERVIPHDLENGTVMYICEVGCRDKGDMKEIRKLLRKEGTGMQGAIWHRPQKQDRVYHFPRQKGREV